MRSLRTALVLGTTLGMTAVLAAAGALLYVLVRTDLEKQFDRSLIDRAWLLASTMEQGSKKVSGESLKHDLREFVDPDLANYMQVWLADGSIFFRSSSLGESDLHPIKGPIDVPVLHSVELPDGRPGRSVGLTFAPRVDKKKKAPDAPEPPPVTPRIVTMALSRSTEVIDRTLANFAWNFTIVGLATLAVSTAVLWLVIWRSLRPVQLLAAQISSIGEHDLSSRIDARCPEELQPVADRLNELLCRLEAAFERERALSADVAHELRTPLAGLRSTIDVALTRLRHPGQYQEALGQCLQITTQMQGMTENLLSLARLDAGMIRSRSEAVVPEELLRAEWKQLEEEAGTRGPRLEWKLGPPAHVMTDPSLLSLVFRNVLGNAIAYTNSGGLVTIETVTALDRMDIRVRNSGSRLTQEQAQDVFERFWRGDAARSSNGTHCGLGLALVKKAIDLLGGTVAAKSTLGGDFEIAVSLPGVTAIQGPIDERKSSPRSGPG